MLNHKYLLRKSNIDHVTILFIVANKSDWMNGKKINLLNPQKQEKKIHKLNKCVLLNYTNLLLTMQNGLNCRFVIRTSGRIKSVL